ncbi:Phospholipase/carboxylesterase [Panaeolus papilionaceus]|nr:Phospholipase/carboxylesterase [Panaeolus papilionaceus]
MSMVALKYLTVAAATKHTATVIFVHGLGDTGYGWQDVAEMFKRDSSLAHVKWILPHAPAKPVTANMGMVMPSCAEDSEGMRETVAALTSLVEEEQAKSGIDPSRILLGGFSQGGAMSLLTGLTGKHKLAGIGCLSGWLPLRNTFKQMAQPFASSVPLFYGHGDEDPLVKPELCTKSATFLVEEVGIPRATPDKFGGLYFHTYPNLPHSVSPKELEDFKGFIKNCLPAEPAN